MSIRTHEWTQDLGTLDKRDYDGVEIGGCVQIGQSVSRVIDPCDAEFFSVYLHCKEGGVECVADFVYEAEAKLYAEFLRVWVRALPGWRNVTTHESGWHTVHYWDERDHYTNAKFDDYTEACAFAAQRELARD